MTNFSKYLKIQFIGYSISTLPENISKVEQEYETGEYLGLPNSIEDIDARIVLLEKAIETARDKIDGMGKSSDPTLKVFVVPEFYFRGANGAYTDGMKIDRTLAMDSMKGWDDHLKYVEHEIQEIINKEEYDNWIFIIGTILVCSANTETSKEYQIKSNVIDSFLRVWKENNIGLDDEGWFELLKNIMDLCNSTSQNIVSNTCLCLRGGKSSDQSSQLPLEINKQYKSMEDFILNRSTSSLRGYQEHTVSYGVLKSQPDTFKVENIKFGIEICLDHRRGRLREEGCKDIDVQIITSCGMQIQENSVHVKPGGLIFNCDGEYDKVEETIELEKSVKSNSFVKTIQPKITETTKMVETYVKAEVKEVGAVPKLMPGNMSHTQLAAAVLNPKSGEVELDDLGKKRFHRFKVVATYLNTTDEGSQENKSVSIDELFAHGSGEVHIYDALDVCV